MASSVGPRLIAFASVTGVLLLAPAANGTQSARGPAGPPVALETLHVPGVQGLAYLARIDPTRSTLALYPGTTQPPVAVPRGPASVPLEERWRLLATFNGGFKYTSIGLENGFAVDGHTYVWLKRGLGTLIEYRDGRIDVKTWHGGPTPPPYVVFARQNLTLLVDRGRAVAAAVNGWEWGATLGHVPAVWRTGVGVDARGNLVYAAAADLTARTLAAILVRAGAVRAIELDINPEWATFIAYRHRGARDPVALVPNPQQSAYRYLQPDRRDFFAVYTRAGGGPNVPYR